jgi:hypothetical protein
MEHLVGGRFGCDVRIRVESVDDPQPREREIAEDILGDQRRPERHDHVGQHDRGGERRERQPPSDQKHEQVARAHDQNQRLKTRGRQADPQSSQRSCQPRRPAAGAGRHVPGRFGGGTRAHKERANDDREQPERAQSAREREGRARADWRAPLRAHSPVDECRGYGGRSGNASIFTCPVLQASPAAGTLLQGPERPGCLWGAHTPA